MAQVLHMEPAFPGKSNPISPTNFGGKDPDVPYSVETPYGYRLDLDFLKYVDDIEKGHTIKRVPVHRKPRYSSLPRGYTGSWWTSTESLCSNASMDSRHSSFSYCGRGFYPAYGLENRPPLMSGLNARVEKTLLDAKKKLEADHGDMADGGRARLSSLGSLHGSRSGSTSSLVGAGLNQSFSKMCSQNGSQSGASGVYTPMSSGLSTPVSPTPLHLQHVREQMAVALRKLKQLEEQVKMIPVLQVKISVLQEEKRQLSVQLKSQRFLGHLGGFGKTKSRGELYIDIPEEGADRGRNEVGSPPPRGSSRQESGFETAEGSVILSPQPVTRKDMKSIGIGTEEVEMGSACDMKGSKVAKSPPETRSLGVSVKEQDLGISSVATNLEVDKQRQMIQALSAKIAVLEKQLRKALHELQVAQQRLEQQVKTTEEKGLDAKPVMADAMSMTSTTWQQDQGDQSRGSRELSSHRPQCEQRTVGVQVYTAEPPMGLLWKHQEVPVKLDTVKVVQAPREPEIAASTSTGVEVKPQRAQSLETKESFVSYKTFQAKEVEGRSTVPTSQQEAPFTIYRTDEVMETSFPQPSSPTGNIFHMVKKISITSHRETAAGDVKRAGAQKEALEALPKHTVPCAPPGASYPDVIKAAKDQASAPHSMRCPSPGAAAESMAGETKRTAPGGDEEDPASSLVAVRSIMRRKEEGADSPNTKKNLQFVGVNGGYESTSSEDSGTAENVSDNESTESEYHEASEGAPLGSEAERRSKEGQRVPGAAAEAAAQPVAAAAHTTVTEETRTSLELSKDLISACVTLQKYLENREAVPDAEMKAAYTTVMQEWLRILRLQEVDVEVVRHHMAVFRAISPPLQEYIINMADSNGNTALHYTVSQSNFAIVKILLDTGLCNVDKQNKAGYTAIMLTALAAFRSEGDMDTVLQMLRLGDVNAKASQAGQTALMLAVSHGRLDMVKALLSCHADVNARDDDGSTALMCACEHGHVDIVRVLLAVPGCDVTLTDHDGSTALSIALEASQNDIAVLLYAHMNFAKPPSPSSPKTPKAQTTDSTN
ncbi:KN motif and ankyrin repeat domain-containing protein 2 [Ambystoma mexicanum]|uniref:KN motif and ankyrin repeat domain-containing protein 2 n=1 Tax=Ambystoma mexicanum TaxID=8296 RepID=UPI0037E8F624